MKWTVRPKVVLLVILFSVFVFALSYFSYLQRYNQRMYRWNIETERISRLVYEMTKEKESSRGIEHLVEQNDFVHYQTKHFDIYCQNGDLAQYLNDKIEKVYESITKSLGYASVDLEYRMGQRIKIVIFKDVETYREKTESPFPWSIGNAVYVTNSFYSYEGPHLKGLVPHELTHLLFYRFLRGRYDLGAMRWLSEGVAMHGESSVYNKFVNEVLAPRLDMARRGEHISIRELIKAKDLQQENLKRIHLWYAECLSIVSFMIEQEGKEKFKEFCLVFSQDRNINNALGKVYPDEFHNVYKLEAEWLRYLKDNRQKW